MTEDDVHELHLRDMLDAYKRKRRIGYQPLNHYEDEHSSLRSAP